MRRGLGTAIVFLLMVVLGALVFLMVVAGISSQADDLTTNLQGAADEIQGWLEDLGVSASSAESANSEASSSLSDGFHALIDGLSTGIDALASLAMFLSFAALSLVFLLKDGPAIRAWGERHLGVPPGVAHTISARVITSLRGYFAGVSVVAAFNAVVIGFGAVVLGVPLAGSIAVINFLGAYIPYIGAWTAGIFTVLITLGAEGPETAAVMALIVLLANGILQQIVQPIAYGATLGLHPLAVLVVTIAAGSLFGTIGLVLAAPLTAAAVKISATLPARARRRRRRPAPARRAGGIARGAVPSSRDRAGVRAARPGASGCVARPGEECAVQGECSPSVLLRCLERRVDVVAERQCQLRRSGNHTSQPDGWSHRDQGPDDLVDVGPGSQRPLGVRLVGAGRRVDCQRRRQPHQGMRLGIQPGDLDGVAPHPEHRFDEALVVEREPAQGLLVLGHVLLRGSLWRSAGRARGAPRTRHHGRGAVIVPMA